MNTTNCYRCQNVFTGYGSLCSNCKQTELLQEEAEKNRKLQESIHSQNMALQRQAAQQAEYARQEAEFYREEAAELARENARVLAESNISSEDAYNYGFNYISLNWARGNNPQKLSITIGEDGCLKFSHSSPYQLPHLNQSFTSGISQSLGQNYRGPGRQYIEEMSKLAGYQIAKGVLPSESFSLGSGGKNIEGMEINTEGYGISFLTDIDEVTGLLTYSYTQPFKNEKLNSLFSDGINQRAAELNTPELVRQRLQAMEEEKNQRLQEQEKNRKTRNLERVFVICVLFLAALGYHFFYNSPKGNVYKESVSSHKQTSPISTPAKPIEMTSEESCAYFKGESPYDLERKAFLDAKIKEFCPNQEPSKASGPTVHVGYITTINWPDNQAEVYLLRNIKPNLNDYLFIETNRIIDLRVIKINSNSVTVELRDRGNFPLSLSQGALVYSK